MAKNKVQVSRPKSAGMEVVKLADIKFGERYRDDYGNIEELMASIKEKGVIQPITLNTNMELLAGGRRYTACWNLGVSEIPAIIRETNGQIDEREIELMENIHRKDFTWQEQAKLTAEIHRLYQANKVDWSQNKTAALLDQNPMNVSRALSLAAAMEVQPSIADCKTASDAHKLLKTAEQNAIVAELAKRQKSLVLEAQEPSPEKRLTPQERGVAATLKVADADYRIGDVFAGLANMRSGGNVDFIECDPPYGVDLDVLTQRAGQANVNQRDANYNEISEDTYADFINNLANELYRVAARDCWMVFWFAFKWMGTVRSSLLQAGWSIDEVPALWLKGNGRTPRPDILLARSYEPFFIARKGQPTVIKQGRMNSWTRNVDEKKYHPAQRPVGLMEDIMSTFLDERQHNVLVPFVGSGATLRACYKLGHRGHGWDSNPEYKNHFMLAVEEDTKKLLSKD